MPNVNLPEPNVVVVCPGPEVNVCGADAGSVKRGLPSPFVGPRTVEIAQHGPATKRAATNAGAVAKEDLRNMGNAFVREAPNWALPNWLQQVN
jgi:hypothetical protein